MKFKKGDKIVYNFPNKANINGPKSSLVYGNIYIFDSYSKAFDGYIQIEENNTICHNEDFSPLDSLPVKLALLHRFGKLKPANNIKRKLFSKDIPIEFVNIRIKND